MVVKYNRGAQKQFPVWENVLLVRAVSEEQAFAKAEETGRAAAGDDDGSFRWRGRAARWEFAGVRKVVAWGDQAERPGDGDEVTYNELQFDSLAAVQSFARGLPAQAQFDEQIPTLDEPKAKRKRA
jgi:hypothetical protein